tara:strand:- start:1 stop:459 length:459 start_codon:yes stop_codon:yes gene_type:complete
MAHNKPDLNKMSGKEPRAVLTTAQKQALDDAKDAIIREQENKAPTTRTEMQRKKTELERLAEQVSSPMISATKATKDKLQPIPDMDRPPRYEALQKMKKQKEESEMDEGMEEGVKNYKKRKLASGGLMKYKKGGMVSRGSGCVSRSKKTKYR